MSYPPPSQGSSSQSSTNPDQSQVPVYQQGQRQAMYQGVPLQIYTSNLREMPYGQNQNEVPYNPQAYYGQVDPQQQAEGYYYASGAARPNPNLPPAHQGMQQQNPNTYPAHTNVQYIPTPPQAVSGTYPSPNPPLFTTSPRSSTSPSTPRPVRYPCELCSATFSRLYDRKRHHETHHLDNPPIHRCDACGREFARADSLKRHIDGGCEKR